MILQSIVIYSALILFMMVFTRLYAIKQSRPAGYDKGRFDFVSGPLFLLLPMLSFSVVMGMRYDVGTDYFAYLNGYIYNFDVGKGEIIFIWIRQLFNQLNLHYSVYFSFLAFINVSFFIYAFKREAFIMPLLIFFLFTNGDWMFWMNGIRQALALCIWIYALNFIEKKKFWWYLFWCVIAIGFHKSAIILISLYPILRNGKDYFKSIKLQLILLGCAFLIQYTFGSFIVRLEPLIEFYQQELSGGTYNYTMERFAKEASSTIDGSGMAYLFRLFLSIIVILYSKRLKRFYNNKWFTIIYFMFFIGLLTQNLFPIGSTVLTRPFRYFFIFQGIMFAYFVYYLLKQKSQYNRIFGVVFIVVFIAIFYLNIITANADAHLWYQFYFDIE